MVTYGRGDDGRFDVPGLPGAERPEPTTPAGSAVRARWPDARRAVRAPAGDDAVRGHAAPGCPRGSGDRHHPTDRPGEAALPQPGPDPAPSRPMDQQVRRAPR